MNCFRLEVKAIGRPKPEGKWLKEGNEILPSNEFIIENFEDGTSILTLPETYPDDVGEIVYEAENPLGVATTVTHLLVETVEGKTSNLSRCYHTIIKSFFQSASEAFSLFYCPLVMSFTTLTHLQNTTLCCTVRDCLLVYISNDFVSMF